MATKKTPNRTLTIIGNSAGRQKCQSKRVVFGEITTGIIHRQKIKFGIWHYYPHSRAHRKWPKFPARLFQEHHTQTYAELKQIILAPERDL